MSNNEANYSPTTTYIALLAENNAITAKATLNGEVYTLEVLNAVDINWSTTSTVDLQKPHKMVYFVAH